MRGWGWLKLLGLSLLTSIAVPFFEFVAFSARMELVGDKPAATGIELERIEWLQGGVTATVYFTQVVIFMFFLIKILRRN